MKKLVLIFLFCVGSSCFGSSPLKIKATTGTVYYEFKADTLEGAAKVLAKKSIEYQVILRNLPRGHGAICTGQVKASDEGGYSVIVKCTNAGVLEVY